MSDCKFEQMSIRVETTYYDVINKDIAIIPREKGEHKAKRCKMPTGCSTTTVCVGVTINLYINRVCVIVGELHTFFLL